MRKITSITSQQKGNRYNLFIDGSFFCGITEETLLNMHLTKGMLLEEADLSLLMLEEEKNKCFHAALSLLERQNYFEKALKDKLRTKGYTDDAIEYAAEKIKQYGYLDTEKLAVGVVNDKKRFSKKGPKAIEEWLRYKGVDRETITDVISSNYTEEEQYENCIYTALKKLPSIQRKAKNKYEIKQKLFAYLMQRGFHYEMIYKVLEDIQQREE